MNNTVSYMNKSELRIINNRRRRERELKRNISIILLSVTLFAVIAVLFFSLKSNASDHSDVTLYKYYKSVEIKPGDTLSGLSCEYMSSGYESSDKLLSEIMYINNLNDSDKLISGNYIIIPYFDAYRG